MKSLLVVILAACGPAPRPPVAPTSTAAPAAANAPRATTFVVPSNWTVSEKDSLTILTPALDKHVVIAET